MKKITVLPPTTVSQHHGRTWAHFLGLIDPQLMTEHPMTAGRFSGHWSGVLAQEHQILVHVWHLQEVADDNPNSNSMFYPAYNNEEHFVGPLRQEKVFHFYLYNNVFHLGKPTPLAPDGRNPNNFFKCAVCSKFIKFTSDSGRKHFRSCYRCAHCRRRLLAPNQPHDCAAPEFDYGEHKLRRYYSKPAQVEEVNWQNRPDIWYADFETYPTPDMVVYAVGLRQNWWNNDDVTIMFGANALDLFMEFVLNFQYSATMFFWNGSAFDVLFILGWLTRNGQHVQRGKMLKKGKRILSLEIPLRKEGVTLTLKDACLLIPVSLANACKAFNVPKKYVKGEFDHSRVWDIESAMANRNEITEYLKLDVLSMQWIIREFGTEIHNLWKLDVARNITLPSLANEGWRLTAHNHIHRRLRIPLLEEDQAMRPAIRGGVVMPQSPNWESPWFKLKLERRPTFEELDNPEWHLKLLDCCGLYAAAMAQNVYPCCTYEKKSAQQAQQDLMVLISDSDNYHLVENDIFEIDGTCPKDILTPFLPARVAETGALIYSLQDLKKEMYVGKLIRHAVRDLGYQVTAVYGSWHFHVRSTDDLRPIFKSFVERNVALRQQFPGTAKDTIGKLNNNSTYGGFLLRPMGETSYTIGSEEYEEVDRLMAGGAKLQALTDRKGAPYAWLVTDVDPNPRISRAVYIGIQILANSQMLMSRALLSINGYRDSQRAYLYKDTDSLLLLGSAVAAFQPEWLGNGLGQFKDDLPKNSRIYRYACLAPKTYILEYVDSDNLYWRKVRCKGIPHNGQPLPVNDAVDFVHNATLAGLIRLINSGGQVAMDIDPKWRAYLHEMESGEEVVTATLSFNSFHGLQTGAITHIYCYAGTFKKHFGDPAHGGKSMTVTPTYLIRELMKESWWQKGHRHNQGHLVWLPAGYQY